MSTNPSRLKSPGMRVGVPTGVPVAVGVRVTGSVPVAVAVGVGVMVSVPVGVAVAVLVGVIVLVDVAVLVGVSVTVLVDVGVGDAPRYVATSACQDGLVDPNLACAAYWACALTMQYIGNNDGPLRVPTPGRQS